MLAFLLSKLFERAHQNWSRPALVVLASLVFGMLLYVTLEDKPWRDAGWRRRMRRDGGLCVAFIGSMVVSGSVLFPYPSWMMLNFAVISTAFAIRAHRLNKLDPWPKGK